MGLKSLVSGLSTRSVPVQVADLSLVENGGDRESYLFHGVDLYLEFLALLRLDGSVIS